MLLKNSRQKSERTARKARKDVRRERDLEFRVRSYESRGKK
jgi:hypothetical protein